MNRESTFKTNQVADYLICIGFGCLLFAFTFFGGGPGDPLLLVILAILAGFSAPVLLLVGFALKVIVVVLRAVNRE